MDEEVVIDKSQVILDEPFIRSVKILSFRVQVLEIIFGKSARFSIYLNGECNGEVFNDSKNIVIVGEEYLAWGNDDNYIIELIKSKLASIL